MTATPFNAPTIGQFADEKRVATQYFGERGAQKSVRGFV